jgi:DNA mismatch endonuclease (patch repair protein)
MADVVSKRKRSQIMAAIKGRGNRDTELKLVAIFREHGITGWRRNQPLFGKPDFVFRRERVAVFVDGCFWHGCPQHGRKPDSNRPYWLPKLARNRARDREVTRVLRRSGWKVLRLWEHDLRRAAAVVKRLTRILLKPHSLVQWKAA